MQTISPQSPRHAHKESPCGVATLYPEIDVRDIKKGYVKAMEEVEDGVKYAHMYFFVQPPASQQNQHLHSMYVVNPATR